MSQQEPAPQQDAAPVAVATPEVTPAPPAEPPMKGVSPKVVAAIEAERDQARAMVTAIQEQLEAQRIVAADAQRLAKEAADNLRLIKVHPAFADEEAASVAAHYYSRLSGDDKPELADWLKSGLETGKLPPGLAAYVSPASAARPPGPPSPATVLGDAKITKEQLMAMSPDERRTHLVALAKNRNLKQR